MAVPHQAAPPRSRQARRWAALLAGATLTLAACGGSTDSSPTTGSSPSTDSSPTTGSSPSTDRSTAADRSTGADTAPPTDRPSGSTAASAGTPAPAAGAAATLKGDNPLPALEVVEVDSGGPVALTSLLPADRPLLVWMWAPS